MLFITVFLILYWSMLLTIYFDVSISIIANASSPPISMLLPPHVENVAHVMAVASTLIAR